MEGERFGTTNEATEETAWLRMFLHFTCMGTSFNDLRKPTSATEDRKISEGKPYKDLQSWISLCQTTRRDTCCSATWRTRYCLFTRSKNKFTSCEDDIVFIVLIGCHIGKKP